jgi:molecular chaperone GrpE (heat shock protein)
MGKTIERRETLEEAKKLSILIDHWIEHNESHMAEYRRWAQKSEELGLKAVKTEIENAIEKLLQCNQSLQKARKGIP